MSCNTIYIPMTAIKRLVFYLDQDLHQYHHEAAINFQKERTEKIH